MSSSTTMLPPSSLPRRRTRIHNSIQYPPSPPASPGESPCGLRKMSLLKATSFHVPSSPPSDDDPVLSIPHLPRRSSTASKTLLALMLGKEEDVTDSLATFDRQFSGAFPSEHSRWSEKGLQDSGRRRHLGRRTPLDLDAVKTVKVSHEHLSDSGLGTSISSAESRTRSMSQDMDSTASVADRLLLLGVASTHSPSETDRTSVDLGNKFTTKEGSRVGSDKKSGLIHSPKARQQPIGPSAITRSISPSHATPSRSSLSPSARKKINELVFGPILQEEDFSFFHPLVHSLEEQTRRRTIKCLRDLEKSLIFEPLVGAAQNNVQLLNEAYIGITQRLTTSTALYRRFGEFSVQLVLDTYAHLSEPEQRRPADRPYDNGYFLDLVQQISRLAAQIKSNQESSETDEMAPSIDDKITLEGGMADTGDIAELCRWKDGIAYSLRTGLPYEPTAGIKRSASLLDDDAERSMARRKKGAEPLEMRCSDKTCGKIFTRKCDLAKHEKTHSRPFKCPEPDCKYHDLGLPTEKERDRHVNDKHSANPKYYQCHFCPFKTKRDSNCKQHMEKKHNWQYNRVKGNGKVRSDSISHPTPQATPQTPSVSTPVSIDYSSVHGSTAPSSAFPTPMEQTIDTFPEYHYEPATPVHLGGSLFGNPVRSGSITDTNPYTTPPNQGMTVATPYSAISAITEQNAFQNDMDLYGNSDMNFAMPMYNNGFSMATPYTPDFNTNPQKMMSNPYTQMPLTPSTSSGHLASTSRNPSVSYTPMSPGNPGLAQTISPQLSLEDDLLDFSTPPMQSNHFATMATPDMDEQDIPMNDFSLFGQDGYLNHAAGESDPLDAYINFGEEGYEA